MKKIYLLFSFILLAFSVHAQWQSNIRLTNDKAVSQTSYNNAWCVAASGDTVHVVWYDNRDGNDEIYYKRSTDGGQTWGADVRLTNDTAESVKPCIAISGSVVNVIWVDGRDGNDEIYYKRSPNAGTNWTSDIRLTNDTADSWFPSMACKGSDVYVVWEDKRNGGMSEDIYYKYSSNGGVSWGSDVQLTINPAYSRYPSIAVNGSDVHVVWFDYRDNNYEIYYKHSTDNGNSWLADTRLTNDTASSIIASIAVNGSNIHVVWTDMRNGSEDVYYKNSNDNGVSWSKDVALTNYSGNSTKPSIAINGLDINVVWYDNRDGNVDIYYKHSDDGGNNWDADENLSNNSGSSYLPSIAISNSILHVVWFDFTDGNREIYYKQYDPIITTAINNTVNSNLALDLHAFPNPAINVLHVECNNNINKNTMLYIRNIIGEVVLNKKIEISNTPINISSFKNGMYVVELKNNMASETTKLIIAH